MQTGRWVREQRAKGGGAPVSGSLLAIGKNGGSNRGQKTPPVFVRGGAGSYLFEINPDRLQCLPNSQTRQYHAGTNARRQTVTPGAMSLPSVIPSMDP